MMDFKLCSRTSLTSVQGPSYGGMKGTASTFHPTRPTTDIRSHFCSESHCSLTHDPSSDSRTKRAAEDALKLRAGRTMIRYDHYDEKSMIAEKSRPPIGSGDVHMQGEQPPPLDKSHR